MADSLISRDQVRHLAHLARLRLDDTEVDRMTSELGVIVEYMGVLATVELDASEIASEGAFADLRDDEPGPGLSCDSVLAQSGRATAEGFFVPPVKDR